MVEIVQNLNPGSDNQKEDLSKTIFWRDILFTNPSAQAGYDTQVNF